MSVATEQTGIDGAPLVLADRQLAAFEDRYGAGSHERLQRLLRRPCTTFAQIADAFGVSRERVRQWHLAILPDAPRGRERRRLCSAHRQRRLLFEEPLFRSFYTHLRPHLQSGELALVPSHDGFRKRVARVRGHLVVLKNARPSSHHNGPAYALTTYRGEASFVYYRLSPSSYLLLPADVLPRAGTTFLDTPASKYRPFRNTIDALGI